VTLAAIKHLFIKLGLSLIVALNWNEINEYLRDKS
jgi:hypothetical protein